MTFDNALKLLRQGVGMTRLDWENPKEIIRVDEDMFTKAMDIYNYHPIPYSFSHADLLASDWEVTRQ
jgi:hypothetical protein